MHCTHFFFSTYLPLPKALCLWVLMSSVPTCPLGCPPTESTMPPLKSGTFHGLNECHCGGLKSHLILGPICPPGSYKEVEMPDFFSGLWLVAFNILEQDTIKSNFFPNFPALLLESLLLLLPTRCQLPFLWSASISLWCWGREDAWLCPELVQKPTSLNLTQRRALSNCLSFYLQRWWRRQWVVRGNLVVFPIVILIILRYNNSSKTLTVFPVPGNDLGACVILP